MDNSLSKVSPYLIKEWSDKNLPLIVFMVIGLVIRYFFAYELWAAYVGSMIFRFGIGMELPAQGVINAENMDYIEYKMGVRAESALTSVSTFLSKVGAAIGGAMPAYLLAIAGNRRL